MVKALPIVIKGLGIIGTVALILVAGGIFAHRIDYFHHLFPTWPSILKELVFGLGGGLLAVALFTAGKGIYSLAFKRK